MLELKKVPIARSTTLNSLNVDEQSDLELDTLPFGVVCLDQEGTILRYNLYEAQFARLDRNQVLGRDFFNEIARCTRGDAFEGQFRRVVASGASGSLAQFPYIFDFVFGAQEVQVEIMRPVSGARWYLLINRLRVAAPRPDRPANQVAVEQRSLAPNERELGVRRDLVERRVAEVPWSFFAALRATCDALAPGTWQLFCAEWGVQFGRRLAIDLEGTAISNGGLSLGELPMSEVARLVSRRLADQGMGQTTFDFAALREGVLVVEVARSMLAEAAPRARRSAEDPLSDLACPLVAGTLGALVSHVAGRRLSAREVVCASSGEPLCRFVVTANERRDAVEAALLSGARGVDSIRAALRRTPAETANE